MYQKFTMSYRSVLGTEEDPCVRQENSDAGLVGKELKKKKILYVEWVLLVSVLLKTINDQFKLT